MEQEVQKDVVPVTENIAELPIVSNTADTTIANTLETQEESVTVQPNKGSIVIDEPDEDDYHFHIK